MLNKIIKQLIEIQNLKISNIIIPSICIIMLLTACGEKQTENPNIVSRPVKTQTITDTPYKLSYYFPGKVSADQTTILSFQVKGRIVEFPIKVGQKVKKGDLLAQLDEEHYKNNYLKCIADYNETKIQYERAKSLVGDKNVISQSEYDERLKNYEVAVSKLNIAKKKLNDASLFAPYSGTIAKKYIENYEEVEAKQPILILQDLTYLEVEIYVPGKHIIDFNKESTYNCYAIFSSEPNEKFDLKLKEYDTIADPQTLSYKVVYKMENPDIMNILPGMPARVRVDKIIKNKDNRKPIFKVPVESVFSSPDKKSYVWCIDSKSNTVFKHQVTVDEQKKDSMIISKGLIAGDVIAITGVNNLHEGQKVHTYKHGKSQ